MNRFFRRLLRRTPKTISSTPKRSRKLYLPRLDQLEDRFLPNAAPVAMQDAVYAAHQPTVVEPLQNDFDEDGDSLAIESFTSPTQGQLTAITDNRFVYVPHPNAMGVDSFSYTVSDGHGGADTATVFIGIGDGQLVVGANLCLMDAVAQANDFANAGLSSTITFDEQSVGAFTGGIELSGHKDSALITIDGGGLVTLSGGAPVVTVDAGVNAHLIGLTITGGSLNGWLTGGAGVWNGGSLTIDDCTITANEIDTFAAFSNGAGIWNEEGAVLTLRGCVVADNVCYSRGNSIAGGVFNCGTLTALDSTFSNNSVICDSSPLFWDNYNYGGAIENASTGSMTVARCTFTDNVVSTTGGSYLGSAMGGAIDNNAQAAIFDSAFSGNQCFGVQWASGGAISNNAVLSLNNCTISNNLASNATTSVGGGVFNCGAMIVAGSAITGNNANLGDGGGICNTGSLTITNASITGNSANSGQDISLATGDFAVASNATVGSLTYAGGTFQVDGALNADTLDVSQSLTLNTSSNATLNVGTLKLANSTLAIAAGSFVLNAEGCDAATGSLDISGGSLILTGSATHNFGSVNLQGGELHVDSSSPAGAAFANLAIESGSRLQVVGKLSVAADLTNSGMIQLSDPTDGRVGKLQTANFTQTAAGDLSVLLSAVPELANSELAANSTAHLAGALNVSLYGDNNPDNASALASTPFQILQANAITGAFATTNLPAIDGHDYILESSSHFVVVAIPQIEIAAIADQESSVGDAISLLLTATSPDGASIVFEASDLPDGLTLTQIDGVSAQISGTISPDAGDSWFETTIIAREGVLRSEVVFSWSVAANLPTLTVNDDMTVPAATTVAFNATATPADRVASVAWFLSKDGGEYESLPLTTLSPQYTFATYGDYEILVEITDILGQHVDSSFNVHVTEVVPTAVYVTATSPIYAGMSSSFAVAIVEPDLGDTASVFVDWLGDGTFTELDDSQFVDHGDGLITFDHTYDQNGYFNPIIRLVDEGGDYSDYTASVQVDPVIPSGRLVAATLVQMPDQTEMDYPLDEHTSAEPNKKWFVGAGSVLEFYDVSPSSYDKFEYHFTIRDMSQSTAGPELVTTERRLTLPDYTLGKTYQVSGFIEDTVSGQQTATQTITIVTAQYAWAGHVSGKIKINGQETDANASEKTLELASGASTSFSFDYDQNRLVGWPADLPAKVRYKVDVFNVGATWLGFGDPGRTLVSSDVYDTLDGVFQLDAYPANREIDVTVFSRYAADGQVIGSAPHLDFLPVMALEGAPELSRPTTFVFLTEKAPTVLDQFLNGMQLVRDLTSQLASNAQTVINAVLADPGAFLGNLIQGLQTAFSNVANRLQNPDELIQRLFDWISSKVQVTLNFNNLSFSTAENAGRSMLNLLLQYSGLTVDHVKQVLREQIGAGNFAAAEKLADLVSGLNSPADLLDLVSNLPQRLQRIGLDVTDVTSLLNGFDWQSLANQLVERAENQLHATIGRLVPNLLAKFIPGASIITSLVQGVNFLIDNQTRLAGIFTSLVNGLGDIAQSVTGDAQARQAKIDAFATNLSSTLVNGGIPLLLDFAASQLGLSKLPQDIKRVTDFIPNEVDKLLRRVVAGVASKVVGAGGSASGGMFAGALGVPVDVTYDNLPYRLWVARDRNSNKVKIAQGNTFIGELTANSFDTAAQANVRTLFNAVLDKATALFNATRAAGAAPRAISDAQTQLTSALNNLKQAIANGACVVLNTGCFAADTMLWTPTGYRGVQEIQEGDLVFARNESDPDGAIEAKLVEKKFERTGRILHIHLPGGHLIRTTPEHPFFVQERGWTAAGALWLGAVIRTDAGWVAIQDLFDTGEYEKVYNVRVSEHHTYFVGEALWPAAVWAHNTCDIADQVYVAKDDSWNGIGLSQPYTVYYRANGVKWTDRSGNAISESTAERAQLQFQRGARLQPRTVILNVTTKSGWDDVLGTTDILSRTRNQAQQARVQLFGNDFDAFKSWIIPNTNGVTYGERVGGSAFPDVHAHHVVVKQGGSSPMAAAAVRQSHLLMRTVGIDPFFGRENLAWAPMWPKHANSAAYRNAVNTELLGLNIAIAADPTPASIGTRLQDKAALADKLKEIAERFFKAEIVM